SLLDVWMGSKYARAAVLAIMVLGYLPLFAQQATYHILLGLASHGLAGFSSLCGALIGAILTDVFVNVFHWGVAGAALAMSIPIAAVNLIVLPYCGCRAADVRLDRYFYDSMIVPLSLMAPLGIAFVLVRVAAPPDSLLRLCIAGAVAVPIVGVIAWRAILP